MRFKTGVWCERSESQSSFLFRVVPVLLETLPVAVTTATFELLLKIIFIQNIQLFFIIT